MLYTKTLNKNAYAMTDDNYTTLNDEMATWSDNSMIRVVGAKENNLDNVNIDLPKNKLIVITGLSGSGKSSLAFDTIYAEGRRRYMESLSVYARQLVSPNNKPDVEAIYGLVPAIAIDQKTISKNPRSTVGTATEIHDYLRLLFARIGLPHSPVTKELLVKLTPHQMMAKLYQLPSGTCIMVTVLISRDKKGDNRKELVDAKKIGMDLLYINDQIYDISETLPKLDKNKKYNILAIIDEHTISNGSQDVLLRSLIKAVKLSDGTAIIKIASVSDGDEVKIDDISYHKNDQIEYHSKFICKEMGVVVEEMETRLFSFNSPLGACRKCSGIGKEFTIDPELMIVDKELSIVQGAIGSWSVDPHTKEYFEMLYALEAELDKSIVDVPYGKLDSKLQDIVMYGYDKKIDVEHTGSYHTIKTKIKYEGVYNILQKRLNNLRDDAKDELSRYQSSTKCSECNGYRLNNNILNITVAGMNIGEICAMSIDDMLKSMDTIMSKLNEVDRQIASKILSEIKSRLVYMIKAGLGYIGLDRESSTLSGGESQRMRLASQMGVGLSGMIYVLDEPSIGLHPSDNLRLIDSIKTLRDMGNTVIVIEHDEETMLAADYLVDIGPGAGVRGGKVIAQGLPEEVINNPNSLTGMYLSGRNKIAVPPIRRKINPKRMLTITNARSFNLKNIDISIPLGIFCSFTGVSGGGKSTLVLHTLYKAMNKIMNKVKINPGLYDKLEGIVNVDKIIQINQSPIGRTPRSSPSTYIGAFTNIRDILASLPRSQSMGYKLSQFSFNVKGGRCENCQGDGVIKIEMHFLPDVYVECSICRGKRYTNETLSVKYKGKSIADILDMTVEEAVKFFKDYPHVADKFKTMKDVGLGYIKIGQQATTLSGGETQRIKLARELSKKSTGNTVYILDEPTTGLHYEDIKKLLKVLHRLVESGNTVIVIEHNLDVIKTSDWVIDIGPKGGIEGGRVVSQGTPEQVAEDPNSVTGKYIKQSLERYKRL